MATLFNGTAGWVYSGGGLNLNKSKTYTGSGQIAVEEDVTDGQTDFLVAFELDISACTAFAINSTQAALIEANDGAGAGGSVTLVANVPYIWTSDTYDTFKFTADITALYVTNSSGSTATVTVAAVYDATP